MPVFTFAKLRSGSHIQKPQIKKNNIMGGNGNAII